MCSNPDCALRDVHSGPCLDAPTLNSVVDQHASALDKELEAFDGQDC